MEFCCGRHGSLHSRCLDSKSEVLGQVQADFLCRKYTAIVIDEAFALTFKSAPCVVLCHAPMGSIPQGQTPAQQATSCVAPVVGVILGSPEGRLQDFVLLATLACFSYGGRSDSRSSTMLACLSDVYHCTIPFTALRRRTREEPLRQNCWECNWFANVRGSPPAPQDSRQKQKLGLCCDLLKTWVHRPSNFRKPFLIPAVLHKAVFVYTEERSCTH